LPNHLENFSKKEELEKPSSELVWGRVDPSTRRWKKGEIETNLQMTGEKNVPRPNFKENYRVFPPWPASPEKGENLVLTIDPSENRVGILLEN